MTYKRVSTFILFICFAIIIFFIFIITTMGSADSVTVVPQEKPVVETTQTVYEPIPLKTQKDFKMLGQKIYVGTGFEPGFTFDITVAGNKFGTELKTQAGAFYVGYLDLVTESTTTKVFSGKMLDKKDRTVDGMFTISLLKCILPNGEDVPLTITAIIGKSKFVGCASQI